MTKSDPPIVKSDSLLEKSDALKNSLKSSKSSCRAGGGGNPPSQDFVKSDVSDPSDALSKTFSIRQNRKKLGKVTPKSHLRHFIENGRKR